MFKRVLKIIALAYTYQLAAFDELISYSSKDWKMHPVSCINTHHEVIDLENHGMVKNAKIWISWKRNINFLQNKEILNLRLRWHILRSYRFVSEWTFNNGSTRHCSGVFIVHFWYVWHVILVHFFCWLWTCKCWMEYFIALISIYLCFGVGSRSRHI